MTTLVAYQAHAAVSWVRILCCLLSEPCTGRVTQSQVPAAGCGYGSPRWVKVASRGSSHLLSNSSRSLVVRTVCNPIGLSSQTLPPSGRCPTFTVDVYLTIGLPAGECSRPCRSSLVNLFNLQQLSSSDGPRILLAVRAVDHRATGFSIWSFSEPLVGLYGITRPARACVRIYRF